MEQITKSGNDEEMTTAVDQARKYLTSCPPAISGQRGIIQTVSPVVGLIHHFSLDDDRLPTQLHADHTTG